MCLVFAVCLLLCVVTLKTLNDDANYFILLLANQNYISHLWQECFDPIVATSGRDLIPVMVYG